ncbi:M23 family metallopeptidase [Metabacillus iocasae]|uniref:Murein DD-endopeptidase MepM/ murein hydrolase activator NlpD n=1 Tax=Priestia iocasae TaxID=2291674 RepID=A0ABS2QV67_9BACI|nr:M23 family metallopeptidase [Metabacillus iocasae]MBM7703378.1 murein DD-endopeptidase MepM/ murein hydrolase activator NlpD [Metabacillus iocasae]
MKRYYVATILLICTSVVIVLLKSPEPKEGQFIQIEYINNKPYVHAQNLSVLGSYYDFQQIDKQLQIQLEQVTYTFIEQVPVMQKNGSYLAIEKDVFIIQNNTPFLSIEFLENELSTQMQVQGDVIRVSKKLAQVTTETIETMTSHSYSVEEVRQYFQSLTSPLKGAHADTFASHIPGANRAYRYGYHEGLDWYTYSAGMMINEKTPVYAMGKGEIVRIDHDYKGYSSVNEREKDLLLCQQANKTPAYILDKLRGRQVWIQYDNGVQARFAHLSAVSPDLKVGSLVNQQTFIGLVGNSGTSGEVKKDQSELHLHVDLLIKGDLFWKGLESEEVQQIIKETF